ncbi:Na+:H+ antiporter, NhaA family [Roseospirillum parvum]|uniref:Na(+)/H(+) antiporter NhaA n=1 Tax=Roseospirillum parvum TaxID=83401 RepID=A0A1G8FS60_9PROT|nr:Na+:H+ antiporter, NhaA family [Roseospirillum parvum]
MRILAEFLRMEAAGGVILVIAAALALVVANSGLAPTYDMLLDIPLTIGMGEAVLSKPLLLWINDGLMAIFFLLVGLEIKREVMTGRLSDMSSAAFPAIAAIGGMVVPALVYVLVVTVMGEAEALLRGWAIPAATDIAFALGVLALLGSRAPLSLKIFLTALAIIDDLGAILIIAAFYSGDLSGTAFAVAGVCVAALAALNLSGVRRLTPYLLIGAVLWVAVLKSGVHATLAGVVLALAIPHRGDPADSGESRLEDLEHALHPWVSYGILPVFAFANAGVSLSGVGPLSLLAPLPLAVALGLVIGKQVGVMAFAWLAIRSGLAKLPKNITWMQVYGVALLTGIGFTMSLFIGTLAFETDLKTEVGVRVGVLAGSLVSAVLGFVVLRFFTPAPDTVLEDPPEPEPAR